METPNSVGVSPAKTSSYSHIVSSETQEMTAPVVETVTIVRPEGVAQLGQTAVIVPVTMLFSAPEPTTVPVVSKMS